MDLRVVLITDLHIAKAVDQGYEPYDSGVARDAFLRRADGSTYVAQVWPGESVFPDFSRAPCATGGATLRHFVRAGVAGFWNDMNEPAIFDVRERPCRSTWCTGSRSRGLSRDASTRRCTTSTEC